MKLIEMTGLTLPADIRELLQHHIDEAGAQVTPEVLAVAVIRRAAQEGNLAEDYLS